MFKVDPNCYFNVDRRRSDLYKGITFLTLKSTKLDNVSTIYHYIQTYDRYKNLFEEFSQLDEIMTRAQNFAAVFLAYKLDQVDLPPCQVEASNNPEKPNLTYYQQVLKKFGVNEQLYIQQEFAIASELHGDFSLPTPNDFLQFILNYIVHGLNGRFLPHAFKHLWEKIEKRVHFNIMLYLTFTNHYSTSTSIKVAGCFKKALADMRELRIGQFEKVLPIL